MVLVRMQLHEYRRTWSQYAFFGLIFPLGHLFLFNAAGAVPTPERAAFVLGGNLVVSLASGN